MVKSSFKASIACKRKIRAVHKSQSSIALDSAEYASKETSTSFQGIAWPDNRSALLSEHAFA